MHRYFACVAVPLILFFGVVFVCSLVDVCAVPIRTHIKLTFCLGIHVILVHVLAIFMVVGSAAAVKDATAAEDWARPLLEKMRALRPRVIPWAVSSMLLGMLAVWMGGAAHTARADERATWIQIHLGVAILAAVVNFVAVWREYRALAENSALLAEVNRGIGERSDK